MLKPGAKLSFLDYVQLPAYNPSDAKTPRTLVKGTRALWQGRGRVGRFGGGVQLF